MSVLKRTSLLKNENNENDAFSETGKTFFCSEKGQKDRFCEGILLLLPLRKALQKALKGFFNKLRSIVRRSKRPLWLKLLERFREHDLFWHMNYVQAWQVG